MAHRDDGGGGAGANDNASGIATLIQLARSYGTPAAAAGTRALSPMHTLVFVATDGGAFGGLGARHFAQTHRGRVLAVVNLDTLGSRGPPRLVLAGSEPRLAAPGIVATASQLVLAQAGQRPRRPSPLAQLVDLGFPFTLYEQGPLLAEGLPALTLTSGGERAAGRLPRPGGPPRQRAPGVARPLGAAAGPLARLRRRAGSGNRDLRLLRPADPPGLGDRARPDRGARAVPGRRRGSLCPLPAAPHPAGACVAQLPQPGRLLALDGRRLPGSSRCSASGRPRPPWRCR